MQRLISGPILTLKQAIDDVAACHDYATRIDHQEPTRSRR